MSLRDAKAVLAAALNDAELKRQRFVSAALKLHATRFHESIRSEFDQAAVGHLAAQDGVRHALAAVDAAQQLARQRRERRSA